MLSQFTGISTPNPNSEILVHKIISPFSLGVHTTLRIPSRNTGNGFLTASVCRNGKTPPWYLKAFLERSDLFQNHHFLDMGVSKNNGTPKSSTLIGFSIINHPFWGRPIFGNHHIKFLGCKKMFPSTQLPSCLSKVQPPPPNLCSRVLRPARPAHCFYIWSGGCLFRNLQENMLYANMIWYDMIWYDMIWYDMTWHDMIWYDMINIYIYIRLESYTASSLGFLNGQCGAGSFEGWSSWWRKIITKGGLVCR